MKILLLQDVKKLGKAGDIVEVSDGYAKNFIMPQKLGKEATKEVLNEWKLKKGSEANRREQEKQAAIAMAEELSKVKVRLQVKGGEGGRLFGSVTAKDIADALEKQAGVIAPEHLELHCKDAMGLLGGIKNAGAYQVEIRLHPAATAKVSVQVEAQ